MGDGRGGERERSRKYYDLKVGEMNGCSLYVRKI